MADYEYNEHDDDLSEEQKESERVKRELLESLAQSIETKFKTRAVNRRPKEQQWLRAAELYYGKLAFSGNLVSRETPFQLVNYTDRPDVNVVRSKCSIAIAQTFSMQFGTGNKNWDLWPAKTATEENAAERAEAMSAVIEAQLDESNYTSVCWKAMRDRVILGSAVLKGPASVGKQIRTYAQLPGTTTWVPELTVDYSPELRYVNTWFFYPDETVEDPLKLGDTIEAHPMTSLDLKKLITHEGFRDDAIRCVLEKRPEVYKDENWSDFAKLSENNQNLFKDKYLVLEYRGPITRTQLDQLDICPTYDSLNDEYYGEVWVCEGQVIRIELESIEASFRPPYYMSVWEKDPGSVFGFGVPLMMEDAQRVVNETWHMILDNSSMSSGAQVAMHKHMVEPANGKWELGPNQIWYLTDPGTSVQEAIQFFNVPNTTGDLIPVMQLAQGFAEEESGIPLITAGLNSPQAVDSATGSLIIQQASTTLLDFTNEEWDNCITEPVIEAWYAWNMQYNDNPDIKGQFKVDVRTSSQYKNKQMHIRDLEKLSVESAQNEELANWINQPTLQRVRLMAMNIPDKGIIKTPEQYAADMEAKAAAQGPNPEVMALQLEARKIELQEAQLAFELKQQQQREVMEHSEKMEATRARLVESEARVAVSQNEKEIELIKLAQRSEEVSAKLLNEFNIARENNQTKVFQQSIEEARKQREAAIAQQEADAYDVQVQAQARNKPSGST
jgi:hypothetical protein